MKQFLMLAAVALSLSASAQTVVHKPVILLKISGGQKPIRFERGIGQVGEMKGDSIYQLVFRNWAYSELIDVKILLLGKKELPGLSKAISTALSAKTGDQVKMDSYSIEKIRAGALGMIHYWLHAEGGYCQLTEKDIKDLQTVIRKEL